MEHIRTDTDRDGAVRTLTIDRPDKRNALSRAMFDTLIKAFEAEPPPPERVTVIRSEGPVFCSGIDLNERLEYGAPPLDRLCEVIRDYPLPVVVRVQGDAIAGGAFLAVSADFVVAAEPARIWFNLVQIGLAPPWPLTRGLLDLAGLTIGRDLVLLGDPLTAGQLAAAHVIASAVPADGLDAELERIVDRLARNAPLSLRAIKATLNAQVEIPHEEQAAMIVRARDSEDGREGVRARLERREPRFSGR